MRLFPSWVLSLRFVEEGISADMESNFTLMREWQWYLRSLVLLGICEKHIEGESISWFNLILLKGGLRAMQVVLVSRIP
jgi:hypothetical protein